MALLLVTPEMAEEVTVMAVREVMAEETTTVTWLVALRTITVAVNFLVLLVIFTYIVFIDTDSLNLDNFNTDSGSPPEETPPPDAPAPIAPPPMGNAPSGPASTKNPKDLPHAYFARITIDSKKDVVLLQYKDIITIALEIIGQVGGVYALVLAAVKGAHTLYLYATGQINSKQLMELAKDVQATAKGESEEKEEKEDEKIKATAELNEPHE
jgi:hypothetical protein